MSDVTPINGASTHAITSRARIGYAGPAAEAGPIRSGDKAELSRAAPYLSKLLSQSDVRTDLVDRVKGEIAQGTYETSEKIDAAIEDLLTDLD